MINIPKNVIRTSLKVLLFLGSMLLFFIIMQIANELVLWMKL